MKGLDHVYSKYKLVYLDTNVVSNICKEGDLRQSFLSKFPIAEKYLLCFSTYTLYEIARNKILYTAFKPFYSIYPCVIVISYFPLAIKEIDLIAGDTAFVNPILLTPLGIRVEGGILNPNSLDALLELPSMKNALDNVSRYTSEFYDEVLTLLEKPEFKHVKGSSGKIKKGDFVRAFMRYELKYRFMSGRNVKVDMKKLKQMKALDVLAHAVYYKFYSDEHRKHEKSDIIDALILTTTPYVHTFISERNALDVLKKIDKQTQAINGLNLLSLADFQKET